MEGLGLLSASANFFIFDDECPIIHEHTDDLPTDSSDNTDQNPSPKELEVVPGRPFWCPMNGSRYNEVLLYCKSSTPKLDMLVEQEVTCILKNAFETVLPPISHPMYNFDTTLSIAEEVKRRTNYEISSITRIQNLTRLNMQNAFGHHYNVTDKKTVYHGTSSAYATLIAKTGFRGGPSKRSKFGSGIYTSKYVFEALAYSEPDEENDEQTFLVVELLTGPCAVGQQNQVDFGYNDHDQQILTLTNPENTIFCASHGDQLLATYFVRVRVLLENEHTLAHAKTVQIYHPKVFAKLKAKSTPTPAAASALTLPPGPSYQDLSSYKHLSIGDRVLVVNPFKIYAFCHGHVGTIKKIIKDGHVHFFVEMCDAKLNDSVSTATHQMFYTGQKQNWAKLKLSNITKEVAPANGSAKSVLGKRAHNS